MDKLKEKLQQLAEKPKATLKNEAMTKTGLIEPVFKALGWDIEDAGEVALELASQGLSVDYCLTSKNHQSIVVEAKWVGENLAKHEKQILNYGFQEGAPLAVLTNGYEWWIYLPMQQVALTKRCFAKITLADDKAAESLQALLGKQEADSGSNLREAKRLFSLKALTHSWEDLLKSPPNELVELLGTKTVAEKELQSPPDEELIKTFLRAQLGVSQPPPPPPPPTKLKPRVPYPILTVDHDDFNYTIPASLIFNQDTIPVLYWTELYKIFLAKVCAWAGPNTVKLLEYRPNNQFESPLVSTRDSAYKAPFAIAGTPYFAAERSGGPWVVFMIQAVVNRLGMQSDDVKIVLAAPKEK